MGELGGEQTLAQAVLELGGNHPGLAQPSLVETLVEAAGGLEGRVRQDRDAHLLVGGAHPEGSGGLQHQMLANHVVEHLAAQLLVVELSGR